MAEGSAQLLSTAQVIGITDKAALAYDTLDAYLGNGTATTSASYYGNRLLGYVVGLSGTYYGLGDHYKIDNMSAGAQNFFDNLCSETFWQSGVSSLMNGLQSNFTKYGPYVSTTITGNAIDTYASYYNTATAFSMLYSASFAKLYYYWKAKASMLSGTNVLSTSVALGTGSVTDATTATFTDGISLPAVSTATSGTQGYSCDNFHLYVSDGTFTGTVTATGINQSDATVTWTAIADTLVSTATFAPATAGHRTRDILGISYSGDGTPCSFLLKTDSRTLS